MKKQKITCLIGRVEAAKLRRGMGCGRDDGAAVACCREGMALHQGGCTGVPQPRGLVGGQLLSAAPGTAPARCGLASSGSKAFISAS